MPESSGNRLTITFWSNSDGQTSTGFRLNYTQVLLGCGGTIQLNSGRPTAVITSPLYPNNYPHSIDCTWRVTAPANHKVQLQFIGDIFNIESHSRYDDGVLTCTCTGSQGHRVTSLILPVNQFYLRNRRWGGSVYVLQMFFVFLFFPSAKKYEYESTVLWNGWTDFHETFTKRYAMTLTQSPEGATHGGCVIKSWAREWI